MRAEPGSGISTCAAAVPAKAAKAMDMAMNLFKN